VFGAGVEAGSVMAAAAAEVILSESVVQLRTRSCLDLPLWELMVNIVVC
jgi:hypothetical protein